MRNVGFVSSGLSTLGSSSFTAKCSQRAPQLQRGPVEPSYRPRSWKISMKTQQETPWNLVKVLSNNEAAEDHRIIAVNVGVTGSKGSLIDSYRIPGMYVQIKLPGEEKAGFYAISSAPNIAGVFEFLVKNSPSAESFYNLQAGEMVEMSPVGGKGFARSADLANATDILLFANGSGIAPIRGAIESRLNGIAPMTRKSVKLYYGCRYPERMAYQDRFQLWRENNVEVIPVMSQPDLGKEEWNGKTGYVQDALKADGVANPEQTAALLCGVKGMTVDVRDYLTSQGVPNEKIFLNF
mmetsp:Transcript_26431/g.102994  ORF Transcript_26431/g.102994 Transcript_26431/m.102994 type:complete len:295 (-) Transcript_26431:115-999(-)